MENNGRGLNLIHEWWLVDTSRFLYRFPCNEVVVRADFRSFEKCGLHLKPTSNGNETRNPVYETFQSISGCRSIEKPEKSEEYPQRIKDKVNSKGYRGLLLGSGMPDEMLFEIVIDPEDFLQEVPLQ
jgi:hypothetical protein